MAYRATAQTAKNRGVQDRKFGIGIGLFHPQTDAYLYDGGTENTADDDCQHKYSRPGHSPAI